jgi:antimicrobial peptide system SdpB family protein
MLSLLGRVGARGEAWARERTPWTNVYGLARSVLAAATALTLVFSGTSTLFPVKPGAAGIGPCDGTHALGLFCSVPAPWLGVASGWRPRLTGALHFVVAFSFHANAANLDGGDAVAAILALLLLPVTLTDPRRWHWDAPPAARGDARDDAARIVALFGLTMIRVQVAVIYFDACISKFGVEEWTDGTALYYWVDNPQIGAAPLVRAAMHPVLFSRAVALLTWSVLVAEYVLSAALVMPKRAWGWVLGVGLALHAGIAVIHGIISFSLTMAGALVLYLRPVERTFSFGWAAGWVERTRRLRAALMQPVTSGSAPEVGKAGVRT